MVLIFLQKTLDVLTSEAAEATTGKIAIKTEVEETETTENNSYNETKEIHQTVIKQEITDTEVQVKQEVDSKLGKRRFFTMELPEGKAPVLDPQLVQVRASKAEVSEAKTYMYIV